MFAAPAAGGQRPGRVTLAFDVLGATRARPEALAARQAQRLAQLLHAARQTRHYRALLGNADPARIALGSLPVCGKAQLMAQWAERVADPRLELPALRAFCADPARVAEPYLGRYCVWESSGSTGQPGVFVQDETAMDVYDALEAWRRHSPRQLARLVDPLYLGERFAFVGAVDGHFASQVTVRRLQASSPWLARHSRSFSIMQPAAELVEALNAFRPSIVATYPTAAVMLADEALRGRLRLGLQEVWTGGETLSPAARAHVTQALGCTLRDSYGASEFLPIAWECALGRLHVNADWVILEAVDAQHRPVPAGTVSHTTLLTNLANHVQPLIRFDIGDCIRFDPAPCGCGSALPTLQVQGRCDDRLIERDAQGQPVTLLPLALTTLLEDEAGVFDFQLCQQAQGRWCLSLGPGAPHERALRERCRELLAGFARLHGVAALRISTRAAERLPLGRSGKLKRIVAAAGAPS